MARSAESTTERFARQFPARLPTQLQWLEKQLRVGRDRMLRLMGLSPEEATAASTREWRELVKGSEFRAEQVEHVLTRYLSFFDYDVKRAREFAREFTGKVAAGTYRLPDLIPALVWAKTPTDEEAAIIEAARQDAGDLLPAMAWFLGSSPEPDDENGTAARPRSSRRRRAHAS